MMCIMNSYVIEGHFFKWTYSVEAEAPHFLEGGGDYI